MTDEAAKPDTDSAGAGVGKARRLPRWLFWLLLGVGMILIAVILSCVGVMDDIGAWFSSVGGWWVAVGWPWTSKWMLSPGFGGAAAVVAASLAFVGSRHQARLNAWWQRVEWALNLYVKPGATDAEARAGIAALEALELSALAKKDEKAFIREVVTAVSLDANGNGDQTDDEAVATAATSDEELFELPSGAEDKLAPKQGQILAMFFKLRDTRRRQGRTGGSA